MTGAGSGLGRATPLVKVLPRAVDPLRLYAALTAEAGGAHSFLLESADTHQEHAVRSLGCANPALHLSGRGRDWSLKALAPRGERLLALLAPTLARSELGAGDRTQGAAGVARIDGCFHRDPYPPGFLTEQERLHRREPMDLLRLVQGSFPLEHEGGLGYPPGGLFGAFAYDFVDCFEDLNDGSTTQADPDPVPDYTFLLADRLFEVDHINHRTRIIATLFTPGDDPVRNSEDYHPAQEFMRRCEELGDGAPDLPTLPEPPALDPDEVVTDLDDAAYAAVVERCKEHILSGDVFQIVPSRSFAAPLREEPLAVYRRLRALNPSPYMFFFRLGEHTLLGASPETALKVSRDADGERRLSIRPIAGTKPRGIREGKIDHDLDSRYESELKLDTKELAEHVMLVDLARNDVARVSEAGSRRAEELIVVEKYSHVQHLVSRVTGRLDPELDPLHAYLATMNMGTLTGAPKVEAMRLLRCLECSRRGFYGGAVGYYSLDGDFDTAIVIRSLLLRGDRALARAGAGVVYDSVPAREVAETWNKARAPLKALGLRDGAGGGRS